MESCFDGKELLLCDAVEPGMMVLAVTSAMTSLSASLVSLFLHLTTPFSLMFIHVSTA